MRAVSRGELLNLLLEEPEYRYLPPRSPSTRDNDTVDVFNALYRLAEEDPSLGIREAFAAAAFEAARRYRGMLPIAELILFEALALCKSRDLGLPLGELARELRRTIMANREVLEAESIPWTHGMRDGLIGDLRRLSRISADLGGSSFFE